MKRTVPAALKVSRSEFTCLVCGDTFPASSTGCVRCTDGEVIRDERGHAKYRTTPTVPTVAYLKEGEYELI